MDMAFCTPYTRAIPYGKHCAGFGGIDTLLVVLDLLFDDLADLACIDMHDPIHPS